MVIFVDSFEVFTSACNPGDKVTLPSETCSYAVYHPSRKDNASPVVLNLHLGAPLLFFGFLFLLTSRLSPTRTFFSFPSPSFSLPLFCTRVVSSFFLSGGAALASLGALLVSLGSLTSLA